MTQLWTHLGPECTHRIGAPVWWCTGCSSRLPCTHSHVMQDVPPIAYLHHPLFKLEGYTTYRWSSPKGCCNLPTFQPSAPPAPCTNKCWSAHQNGTESRRRAALCKRWTPQFLCQLFGPAIAIGRPRGKSLFPQTRSFDRQVWLHKELHDDVASSFWQIRS